MLPANAPNVLFCLRYGIGDVIMELPVLTELREALPDARITVLANPPAHELLEGDPRVDTVVVTSRWGRLLRWDRGTPAVRTRIDAWVRAQGFDLVLDARHAPNVIGQALWSAGHRTLEGDSAVEEAALAEGRSGVAAIRRAATAGWGLPATGDAPPRLHLHAEHHAAADQLLSQLRVPEGRPFALSPVASSPLKRWPPERFAAVADHIVEHHGAHVLILEGPQPDSGAAVAAAMRAPDAAVRVGPHHLLVTAALLSRCRVLLSHDTGLMHMGAAVGLPTLGVFGPTRPELFAPPGRHAAAVGPRGVDCGYRDTRTLQPPFCWEEGRCLVGERSCIDRVEVEEVTSRLERLLALPAAEPRRPAPRARGSARPPQPA